MGSEMCIRDSSITFVPDERGQMRPATPEEKAAAAQQPVLIGASIPVRPSNGNEA